ncbi:MAG: acetyl-CoA C-acetyltransferase [Candidatus Methanoperedens sp.]|nr:acetyl-CoA C-acetyltransferase [Candidatus Methanoperedens sp.]
MNKVVIVSATRTAIGKFGGSLKDIGPGQLGSVVVKDVLKRVNFDPGEVDEVIMGSVLTGGQGMNVARQSSIWGGLPIKVPAYTVNKVCGSSLKSVILGAQAVMLGDDNVVLAGGTESMSTSRYALPKARWGIRMGNDEITDTMIYDGLWDIFNNIHMGVTAENLAEKYSISREEQDEFAAKSQNKAEAAIKAGKFKEEIVPVPVPQPKGEPLIFDTDEFPRFGTTKETLSKLKPAFKKNGTVTAGNASGVNDGAAAVLLMSEEKAKEKGLSPMATVVSYGYCGVPPEIMGMGPVCASSTALSRADLTTDDIDLIEENEAFAAQSIAVDRELRWDLNKVNVNGGAIALGHPIGASGTRILVSLLYEMKRRDSTYGLATMCIGGGMGIAMVVKR